MRLSNAVYAGRGICSGQGNADGQYIVVKDSQVLTTVYTTEDAALDAVAGDGNTGTKDADLYQSKVYAVTIAPAQNNS